MDDGFLEHASAYISEKSWKSWRLFVSGISNAKKLYDVLLTANLEAVIFEDLRTHGERFPLNYWFNQIESLRFRNGVEVKYQSCSFVPEWSWCSAWLMPLPFF